MGLSVHLLILSTTQEWGEIEKENSAGQLSYLSSMEIACTRKTIGFGMNVACGMCMYTYSSVCVGTCGCM